MKYLANHRYFYTYRFILRWKIVGIISFPIILLPVLIITHFTQEGKCGYILLLVALYWIFDVIPLAVTALLPAALLPLLGVIPSRDISPIYMKDINMLLFVGIACAIGVEYSNLHRRIALGILLLLGTKPRWLILGFMLPSILLSMWITNTSTAAMMTPIADSLLKEMYPFDDPDDTEEERESKKPEDPTLLKESYNMRNGILLCICTGSCIGGTGTVTGTGANLVMTGLVENMNEQYGYTAVDMNYVLWMAFCIPNLLLCSLLMWFVFQIIFLGFRDTFTFKFHEVTILVIFIILILFWIFRAPGFMTGWAKLIGNTKKVKDSAAAVLAITLMFALPCVPDWWWSDCKDRALDPPPPRCLTWEIIHARFTWGVVFIMGGGFALADACQISGLSAKIASWLLVLEGTSPPLLCLTVMLVTVALTTVTSNTATSTILLPIMIELSNAMKIAPLFLLLPTTLSCSMSFLLPISTPPNAIVYERSRMTIPVMAKTGFWLALVCVSATLFTITFYAPMIFEMEGHPDDKPKPTTAASIF